ncbi:hypothetical protein FD755_008611, partial [Muntiacus reevesi]
APPASRPAPSSATSSGCPSALGSPAAVPQQPGLTAQVAVGSATGHTLGHVITAGFSAGSSAEPSGPDLPQLQQDGPCFYEVKQLLECAQSQGDLTFCDGFSEVLKQCRLANHSASEPLSVQPYSGLGSSLA